MPLSLIPFMLLIVPIIEIGLFIVIGERIGLWPTLAMIVVTAIIGSILLRTQGFATINRIRAEMEQGGLPGKALFDGAMIVIAGILLLTPGFFTDTLGFLLFVPPVRAALRNALASRVKIVTPGNMGGGSHFGDEFEAERRRRDNDDGSPVIDLDADDFQRRDPDSPWHTEGEDKTGR